ncbi:MAG: hypothetical protein FXV79_01140 [Candidatus Thioglobus sp.]|nr:MAG: hypothetical protein FXV79_01140 [Candidatus Thioglobus sp.]
MFRFIEKVFLKITQIVGLLLAAIVLIMAVFLGYERSNIQNEKTDIPLIKFADYQKTALIQQKEIVKKLDSGKRFNQDFNAYSEDVAKALRNLSGKISSKNLEQKVKVSIKIKVNQYPRSVQLQYIQSLAKLINQAATVGAKVNVEELTDWHDQSFFQQIRQKDDKNFLQIASLKIEKVAYSAIWDALIIFMILIIMLAVLRIEQNTRKK